MGAIVLLGVSGVFGRLSPAVDDGALIMFLILFVVLLIVRPGSDE